MDSMEETIRQALDDAGLTYRRNDPLDFELKGLDGEIGIECKRFFSPRITEQIQHRDNVIVIQGLDAACFFARLLSIDHATYAKIRQLEKARTRDDAGRRLMTIEEAVYAIIGQDLADSIISDMGLRWAVVAAMAEAKESDDPRAISTIKAWIKQQKRDRA